MSIHAEWLSLIEISGAFLAEPILDQAFPQGLEGLGASKKQAFRQTYDEWREAQDTEDEFQAKLHQEWINWVLKFGLEWDEVGDGEDLKAGADVPADLKLELLEHNLILKPDYALFANDTDKPYLLVVSYPAHIDLNNVVAGDAWSTTPAERMSHLCRATGTRLGLVTNGEQWMIVDAPEGGITSYASWYARLWSQEPITLKAFFSLLNIRTVFSGFGLEGQKLTELLDDSLKHQDEVTETLGAQVQRAVEVLIQSIDRINNDSNGELLDGVEPSELYEAGLTYMMRLVFLLCAEERGLLLLGDETYEANYAVSTLRMKLRDEAGLHGEEVLSYRNNAWARLLAVFRAVYGGVEHEDMRMPALGGSLFDPDRFPFLEGRSKGSSWKIDEARPLPIDNRTVLLFLDAIQIFKGRTLSYRALDVEQIGYVYEGLLERTVIRSPDVTLELAATKSAKKPWLLLGELESARLDGEVAVNRLLRERTGSSASRITKDLAKEVTDTESEKLLLACHNNSELRNRIKPYFHFLRADAWGNPLLYPKNAFMVATGVDRRETGTHYTPKSLTEAIITDTLEPVVYTGPSEGKDKIEWVLRSPEEILALKICDPAMGSGAFLVQVCRYLSERLLEAWVLSESIGKQITVDGYAVDPIGGEEKLVAEPVERLIAARRLIGEKCLYGVDVNPLAVELAKLSIWLVTLAKGRPFGFLDHNLHCGDSLLGITNLDQLHYLDMKPREGSGRKLFSHKIDEAVQDSIEFRYRLIKQPILDIRDVELMAYLDHQSKEKMLLPRLVADALVAESLNVGGTKTDATMLSIEAGQSLAGDKDSLNLLGRRAKASLSKDLPDGKPPRKTLHWCLEFPEVFLNGGFDAIVGNPPFFGGLKLFSTYGEVYRDYLFNHLSEGESGTRGAVDLCAFFFLQSRNLLREGGCFGLMGTNSISQGDTRKVSLESIVKSCSIYSAVKSFPWPGKASLDVAIVHVIKGAWKGNVRLNNENVSGVSSYLDKSDSEEIKIHRLKSNINMAFQGSNVCGSGFVLTPEQAAELFKESEDYKDIVSPYLNGRDVNINRALLPLRYVVDFKSTPLKKNPILPSWFSLNTKERKKIISEGIVPSDYPNPVATDYPACLNIVEREVKPERESLEPINNFNKSLRLNWWKFGGPRLSLYSAISSLDRVLVTAAVSGTNSVEWMESNFVFDKQIVCFASDSDAMFAILQSSLHWAWARKNGSSMGGTGNLRYTPTSCYQTLPLPTMSNKFLTIAGKDFHELRRAYLEAHCFGLTSFARKFHDASVNDIEMSSIRDSYIKLDNSVCDAYGWEDLELNHGFHSVSYLPEGKNIRFTISEYAQEELLRRLSELNKNHYLLELKT